MESTHRGLFFPHGADLYLQDVASSVVLRCPAESMQHLEHLVLLQHGEQPVQEYLQAYRERLATVKHQTGDVKRRVGLYRFGSTVREEMSRTQLVQSCNKVKSGDYLACAREAGPAPVEGEVVRRGGGY